MGLESLAKKLEKMGEFKDDLVGIRKILDEQRLSENYHRAGMEVLAILNGSGTFEELIREIIFTLKNRTGFNAVGIRLKDGEDFPYLFQDGFSSDFLLKENSLLVRDDDGVCRDENGNVKLECTCGLVISGKTDPNNSLFTEGGSCWTNDSSMLLAIPREEDPRLHPRNECIHRHYNSVALVPIRAKEMIVGLLQFNDHRKDCFTLKIVELLERIASSIGEALMRRQAEERAMILGRQNQLILEAVAEGIFGLDLQGRHTFVNPAAAKMLGYVSKELIGRQSHEIWHHTKPDGSPYPQEECRICAAYRKGVVCKVSDELFWRKDGSSFPVEYCSNPIYNEAGELTGAVVTFTDITERIRREVELKKAKDEAELANTAKDQFLFNMSHEIRTPLNGMMGMLQMLELENITAEEQREYISVALRSGTNLLSVINLILDFAKIASGKMELDVINFDLNDEILNITKLLSLKAVEKGVKLTSAIEVDVPKLLRGDAGRLRQIIINLVNNAIKFTEKGTVRIHVLKEAEDNQSATLRFLVRDSGIGIPSEKLHSVFEPFVQADSSTTRKYGGTGLGLSIVRQLVELMGGTVGIKSELGKGSTFWFRVTLGKREVDNFFVSTSSLLIPGDHENPLRVLVVEDDVTSQTVISVMLRRFGCQIDIAANGKEAVDRLVKNKYDLVLMDCMMPEMNGYEATSAIRSPQSVVLQKNIPIIALTGGVSRQEIEKCFNVGMDDHLAKPVNFQDLSRVIKKWTQSLDKK